MICLCFPPPFFCDARVTLKRAHLGLDDLSKAVGSSMHPPGTRLHIMHPSPPSSPAAGATATPLPQDAPPPLRLSLSNDDPESGTVVAAPGGAIDHRNSFSTGLRTVVRSLASSTSTSSEGGLFIPLYPWVPREPGSWRRLAQLRRDVSTLYHLRHPRLVSLMGAVWDSKIEPVLVFESMDGGAPPPTRSVRHT